MKGFPWVGIVLTCLLGAMLYKNTSPDVPAVRTAELLLAMSSVYSVLRLLVFTASQFLGAKG